jgi:tetratricopeptide (TPR) repeat protein
LNLEELNHRLESAKDRLVKNDLAAAQELFAEVLAHQHNSAARQMIAAALRGLATIAHLRGEQTEAMTHVKSALQIDNDGHSISGLIEDYELQGRLYLELGILDLAQQALENAVKFEPQGEQVEITCRAHTNIAFILRSRGDVRGAIRSTLRSIRLAKAYNLRHLAGPNYAVLAAISLTQGRVERARILLRGAR